VAALLRNTIVAKFRAEQ